MDALLRRTGKICDQAEIYATERSSDTVSFENARLKDIKSTIQSGVSLRILKNGKQGFAYTKNLGADELVQNAHNSLQGGVDGLFTFPLTKNIINLETYNPQIETVSNNTLVEECIRVCELLSQRTQGQINISASRSVMKLNIKNTAGTDLSLKSSIYALSTGLLYPHTSASLHRVFVSKSFEMVSDEYINFLGNTYNQSTKEISPHLKGMKVMFMPETVYVLMRRVQSGVNAQSIYQNISPISHKKDMQIFDEKLSISNNPLNDHLPLARAFDDEGVPCRKFPLVHRGVLKNFYNDLYFAQKLGTAPTGHGFRSGMLGGEPVATKPVPSLSHLTIEPGAQSFDEMVHSVDRGIIIAEALGGHSGNIPNGDFSIGVSPALYIEKGEIIGHVKDVMVAGNIYSSLNNIVAVENTLHTSPGGTFPSLLLDNVHLTAKT